MKIKKISGSFALCFHFLSQATNATTLKETVIVALETNPSVSADEAAKRATELGIDAARSGYFPSLDLYESMGRQYTRQNLQATPFNSQVNAQVTRNITAPSVSLRQNIFDGLATPFAVEHAEAVDQQADFTLGQTIEKIAFTAISAHENVCTQQRILELDIENIKKHEEILRKVQKRVDAGISTIADVDQVKSRLEDAKVVKERTEGLLAAAIADYIAVTDFNPQKLENPSFPRDLFSVSLDSILARVNTNNPTVQVTLAQLKAAEAQFNQSLTPFLPTIRVELNANDPVTNPGGEKGTTGSYTAQIVGQYNLFSGGKDLANRKAQGERVVQAKKLLDASRREAIKQARNAYAKLLSDDQQVQELKKAVDVNIKLQREYELQFVLVSRPLLDLLDAYVSYYQTKNNLINQEADTINNYALVLASMGELASFFTKKVPEKCVENYGEDESNKEYFQEEKVS